MSYTQAVSFGVGAGSFEATYVFIAGVFLSKDDPQESAEWAAGADESYCVRYMVPIERCSALLGHISSRGLIYIGLVARADVAQASLIAIACLLFACVDGVAAYGILKRWDWYDPKICFRAHLYFFLDKRHGEHIVSWIVEYLAALRMRQQGLFLPAIRCATASHAQIGQIVDETPG